MIDADSYAQKLLQRLDEARMQLMGVEFAILFLTNAVREVQLDAIQEGARRTQGWNEDMRIIGPGVVEPTTPEVPKNQVGNFFEVEDGRVAFDVFPRE